MKARAGVETLPWIGGFPFPSFCLMLPFNRLYDDIKKARQKFRVVCGRPMEPLTGFLIVESTHSTSKSIYRIKKICQMPGQINRQHPVTSSDFENTPPQIRYLHGIRHSYTTLVSQKQKNHLVPVLALRDAEAGFFIGRKEKKMIEIEKSPTADTRTCDVSKVEKSELLRASQQHIADVGFGILCSQARRGC